MDRRTLYVDIDDTLLMHNLSDYGSLEAIMIEANGRQFWGVPNDKNILLVQKFYRLGYDIVAWSKTGKTWAKAVCKALDVAPFVSVYLTKPDFYLDDKPVEYWMGPRVYRDSKTGAEG